MSSEAHTQDPVFTDSDTSRDEEKTAGLSDHQSKVEEPSETQSEFKYVLIYSNPKHKSLMKLQPPLNTRPRRIFLRHVLLRRLRQCIRRLPRILLRTSTL